MDEIPHKLGKYTLTEQLGSGSFGTVYKASDSIGRFVAVKVLKPGWTDDPATIERFRREAQVAGELFHNRIATIIDFDEFEGRLFLVMRYIDAISLDKLIRQKGRLGWAESIQILSQVADGLDYAHQRGFVHRDIKPANILVSDKDGAVLTDFGLVRAAEMSGMSTSGVMLGTPPYIAPEIWEGKPAGPGADIYSLACVVCEMLTGEALFNGTNTPAIMTRHMQAAAPLPENWPEGIPQGINSVLARAFEHEPANRYPSSTLFIDDLKKKGDKHLKQTEEVARQKAEIQAHSLLAGAETLLAERKYQAALNKINQAAVLVPGLAEIEKIRERLNESMRLVRLYDEAAGHYQDAREKALAVLAGEPLFPDSREIFSQLGLRQTPTSILPGSISPRGDLTARGQQEESMPLWNWARRAGILLAGLMEVVGLNACFFLFQIPNEIVPQIIAGLLGGVFVLVSIFSIQALGSTRMVKWTKATRLRPAWIWIIFSAYMATFIGVIPAVFLLFPRPAARTLAQIYAGLLGIAILGIGINSVLGIHSPDTSLYLIGLCLTAGMIFFLLGLCVSAFVSLNKPEMRAYFENREA